MMRKRTLKSASLAALAATLLPVLGCLNLEAFWRQTAIGFARGVGELPVGVVNDLFFADLFGPAAGS